MKTVGLIVGHSTKSPGATNESFNFSENMLAQLFVDWIASECREFAKVKVFDREGCSYQEMVDQVAASGVCFYVSSHFNAYNTNASGTETLYCAGSEKGEMLAKMVQYEMVQHLGLPDRGVKPRTINHRGGPILVRPPMPGVIIEPFFIDNDADLISGTQNIKGLCESITHGIKCFANLKEVE